MHAREEGRQASAPADGPGNTHPSVWNTWLSVKKQGGERRTRAGSGVKLNLDRDAHFHKGFIKLA